MATVTHQRLLELLVYDCETGVLRWRIRAGRQPRGSPAGHMTASGYVSIRVDRKLYLAHRLVWLWMTREWPILPIDHINRIGTDNRWCNLRLATMSQNLANAKRPRHNMSGYKGVSWDNGTQRWRACITHEQKRHHLGLFDTPQQAHQVYCAAAAELFGAVARAA